MKEKKLMVIKIGRDIKDDLKLMEKRPEAIDELPDNAIYFKSFAQFASILSEKRMSLLDYVINHYDKKVTDIAIELHRKQEAISRDLHELQKFNLIECKRKGKSVYPKAEYDAIEIQIRKRKK